MLNDYSNAINHDAEAEQIRRSRQGLARQDDAEKTDGNSEARVRSGEEIRSSAGERGSADNFGGERLNHCCMRARENGSGIARKMNDNKTRER